MARRRQTLRSIIGKEKKENLVQLVAQLYTKKGRKVKGGRKGLLALLGGKKKDDLTKLAAKLMGGSTGGKKRRVRRTKKAGSYARKARRDSLGRIMPKRAKRVRRSPKRRTAKRVIRRRVKKTVRRVRRSPKGGSPRLVLVTKQPSAKGKNYFSPSMGAAMIRDRASRKGSFKNRIVAAFKGTPKGMTPAQAAARLQPKIEVVVKAPAKPPVAMTEGQYRMLLMKAGKAAKHAASKVGTKLRGGRGAY